MKYVTGLASHIKYIVIKKMKREFEDNFIMKLFISIEVGLKPFHPSTQKGHTIEYTLILFPIFKHHVNFVNIFGTYFVSVTSSRRVFSLK